MASQPARGGLSMRLAYIDRYRNNLVDYSGR